MTMHNPLHTGEFIKEVYITLSMVDTHSWRSARNATPCPPQPGRTRGHPLARTRMRGGVFPVVSLYGLAVPGIICAARSKV